MADREKTIKGLIELHGSKETMDIIRDAIVLLRERDAVEPKRGLAKTQKAWFCGACGFRLNRAGRFCSKCGREVKWDD